MRVREREAGVIEQPSRLAVQVGAALANGERVQPVEHPRQRGRLGTLMLEHAEMASGLEQAP